MRDFGQSDDPRVQAQLGRLSALSVPQGRLGLETIRVLMERLGNPHRKLPPVFHVAGTNGKGSTCAFLRAMLEAQGYRVHVTTSPHLVRYNERIRLAGELISNAALAAVLAEVLDASEQGDEDLAPSFFEVTIAAAFLAFSRVPADACVVEVGMGGRFDATNVLEPEALVACGIAALGVDHERFLLAPEDGVPTEPMARIAFEKAGIAKKGVPLIVRAPYEPEALEAIEDVAEKVDAPLHVGDNVGAWAIKANWRAPEKVRYADWQESSGKQTSFVLPRPNLAGEHQIENAGLAIAMLRHQQQVRVTMDAITKGLVTVKWPARLQRLSPGPLTGHREVWLDGGHNPNAAQRLFAFLNRHIYADRIFATGELRPIHLIIGMIEGKDPTALTASLATLLASITAVPVPGHDWHPASAFGPSARAAPDVPSAMAMIPDDGLPVLIAGSLYLAGEVLRLNDELPD